MIKSKAIRARIARIALLAGLLAVVRSPAHAQDNNTPLSAPTRPATSKPTQPGAAPASGNAGGETTPALAFVPTAPRTTQPSRTKAAAPPKAFAPAKASATSPRNPSAGAKTVTIDGFNYIELPDFAKAVGCSVKWKKAGKSLTVTKGPLRIEFTGDSRDFHVNGTRVFAGSAIRIHKRSLWISRIDADNLLAPIANPALGRASVVPLKVIALDPGHGGYDKGKVNERLKIFEKTFTLDTAFRLKGILEKRGYKVVMTRTTDKKIDLGDRPEIAAKAGADLFVSIHFNSVESGAQRVTGAEVYRFTPRYQVPLRRNKSIPEDSLRNPGDAGTFWSSVAALKIQQALLAELKVSDRGFKHDNLAVLRLAKCPAVLVEAGFLSNNDEARKIATPAYRQKIAEAIADGIGAYATAVAAATGR